MPSREGRSRAPAIRGRGPVAGSPGIVAAAVASAVLYVAASLSRPALVLAASPTPPPGGVGDPRSVGQGPGLVGDPLAAILVVVAIATLTIAATLLYVRLTGGRRTPGAG
jgi:hypothetical protein